MAEDVTSRDRSASPRRWLIVTVAVAVGVAIGVGIRIVRQQEAAPPEQDAADFAVVEPTIAEYLQRPVRAAGDRLPEDLSPPRCALTHLGDAALSADTTRWFVVYRCAQFRRGSGGDLSVEREWGGPAAVDVHVGGTGPGIVQAQEAGEDAADLAALFPEEVAARLTEEGDRLWPAEQVLLERAREWFERRAQATPARPA